MTERFVGISEYEDELRIYDNKKKQFLNGDELLDYLNKYDEEVKYLQKVIVILKSNITNKVKK